ncbi:MAG: CYTH domain-containing protein [Bdellovibrionales bacterium]|nr:CYTH domain-containing protein [Bdellovibrionales bacterium]
MSLEIERKYLPNENFDESLFSEKKSICQGFICADEQKAVRVRIKNEQGYLTVKGPSDESGLSRFEFETPIPLESAEEMLKLCLRPLIEKTRYIYVYKDQTFEIDVFHGENKGLVIIELELEDKNSKVDLPPFIGMEVTGDPKYYNAYLAKKPYLSW